MLNVTIFNEFIHERRDELPRKIYPNGIHSVLADFIKEDDICVRIATLDMPEHGLTQDVLDNTDVLVWWAHCAHDQLSDEIANRVHERILRGMGFVALHSSHYAKPFRMLMGTTCNLSWRDDDRARVWCVNPYHPIAQGLPASFDIETEEMYGEYFDVPAPDELVFLIWYAGGELFRGGMTYKRGYGKIFFFSPGHEEYPVYYNENIQKVIKNAVRWAAPSITKEGVWDSPHAKISAEQMRKENKQ